MINKIKLEEIVEIYLGLTHTPKYVDQGIPFLSVRDISNGKIDFSNCHYITDEEYEKLPNGARPQTGDMLFCRVGTLGKPIIIDADTQKFGSFVSLGFLRLKNKNFILEYVKYWMNSNSFTSQVSKNVKGVAQVNLNTGWLSKFELPIYELDIQKKLVERLDIISDVISQKKVQIEKLNELIKSQFVGMFENKNFEKITIGKCAKFQGGYAFKSQDFVENGIKLVQISNVNKDTLDWIEINRVPESFEEKYKDYSLLENDVVMAMTRPIIKSLNEVKIAKVTKEDLPCLLNQRVGRFIINEKINKEYLIYCCKSDKFKNYVEKMSGNSLQPNISSKQVENYEISLPPIELQNKFAEFVKQIDKQKFEIENSLKEMQELYESLMEKYFG